jgi:peptidoglycan hydrolase-like protein with peptidoglycan-binding domain
MFKILSREEWDGWRGYFCPLFSVGAGGVNRVEDVMLVQFLLNRAAIGIAIEEHQQTDPYGDPSNIKYKQILIDGICGPQTKQAIRNFQSKGKKAGQPLTVDGRIDSPCCLSDIYAATFLVANKFQPHITDNVILDTLVTQYSEMPALLKFALKDTVETFRLDSEAVAA